MKRKYRVYKMTVDRLLDSKDGFLFKKSIACNIQKGDEIVFEARYRDSPTEFIQCFFTVTDVEDKGDYWILYFDKVLYNEYDWEMHLVYSFEVC